MRTLILSDLHLGSRHCQVDLLEEVVRKESFDRLILNGDTINNVNFRKLTPRHWRLLESFRDIARRRELILVRGNHDHEWDYLPGRNGENALGTGHVLPALLGVPMQEEYRLEVRGEPYLVLHGDRFDPTMNFQPLTEVAFQAYQVTTKFNKKLAKWLKKKSKRWGGILTFVRNQSVAHVRAAGLPGVVTGHTHFAEDLHVDDVHYLNTGSWTESPYAYVTVDPSGCTLHHVSD